MRRIDDILRDYVRNRRAMEELSALLKERQAEKSHFEQEIRDVHEASGSTVFKAAGLTVTVDPDAQRAKYDPAAWEEIMQWALINGHGYIIQRRLSDAKIIDLASSNVEFPEGLSLEPYTKLSVRKTGG